MWTVIIVLVVLAILAIWMIGEFKRTKHKFVSFFIIILIVFTVFTVIYVFKDQPVDYKSVSGLFSAGKVYFSWLGSAFGNVKMITSNAIKMDWKGNQTVTKGPSGK